MQAINESKDTRNTLEMDVKKRGQHKTICVDFHSWWWENNSKQEIGQASKHRSSNLQLH